MNDKEFKNLRKEFNAFAKQMSDKIDEYNHNILKLFGDYNEKMIDVFNSNSEKIIDVLKEKK